MALAEDILLQDLLTSLNESGEVVAKIVFRKDGKTAISVGPNRRFVFDSAVGAIGEIEEKLRLFYLDAEIAGK